MSNANQSVRPKLAESVGVRLRLDNGASDETTPGVDQTLISYTTASNEELRIFRVRVSSLHWGRWWLEVDGDEKAFGKVGPGNFNDDYLFIPFEEVGQSGTIELKFKAGAGTPATQVKAEIQARAIVG